MGTDVSAPVVFIHVASALNARFTEAEQLHGEIWSHLEAARHALARRGFDVSRYDAVRDRARPGGIAAERAAMEQACHALRSVLPDVDWDAPDPADTLVGAPRPTSWTKPTIYTLAAVLALAVGALAL